MPDPPAPDDQVTIATPAGASSSEGRRASLPPVFARGCPRRPSHPCIE
jgi:hypothetical protein